MNYMDSVCFVLQKACSLVKLSCMNMALHIFLTFCFSLYDWSLSGIGMTIPSIPFILLMVQKSGINQFIPLFTCFFLHPRWLALGFIPPTVAIWMAYDGPCHLGPTSLDNWNCSHFRWIKGKMQINMLDTFSFRILWYIDVLEMMT